MVVEMVHVPVAGQPPCLGFSENQEVRVILAGVNLPKYPANSRMIVPQQHKQVFDNKPVAGEFVD